MHTDQAVSLRMNIQSLREQIAAERDPLRRLHLIQRRLNAEQALRQAERVPNG